MPYPDNFNSQAFARAMGENIPEDALNREYIEEFTARQISILADALRIGLNSGRPYARLTALASFYDTLEALAIADVDLPTGGEEHFISELTRLIHNTPPEELCPYLSDIFSDLVGDSPIWRRLRDEENFPGEGESI